jgi:hypothetical protein
MQSAHEVARSKLIESKEKSKSNYDRKTGEVKIKVGDTVLLFDKSVRRGRSKKLSAQWIGPYEVLDVNKVNATIKKGHQAQKVHVNRLKPFY